MVERSRRQLTAAVLSLFLFIGATAANAHAQEVLVEFDPAASKITFTLGASLHTVHGIFQLKSGALHFDPASGSANGIFVADAQSGETGNQSRDHKMHREVLESDRFPEITYIPIKVSRVGLEGASEVQVEGRLRLQGVDHPLSLVVPAHISGDRVAATTRFTIPYVAWGLKNPSTFFLHVSDKVEVQVQLVGRLKK